MKNIDKLFRRNMRKANERLPMFGNAQNTKPTGIKNITGIKPPCGVVSFAVSERRGNKYSYKIEIGRK